MDPSLQAVVSKRGWQPTPIQEASLASLCAGEDRLLVAPTGGGKTQAAILPLLNRAVVEEWDPLAILYITPLRALNRDVDRRLKEVATEVGLRVDTRHGDTTPYQRQKQVKNPPHLLVTTPETFQLLFTGHRLREMISNVRAVVIDEVHEVVGSERGWQLSLGLARLQALVGRPIQRIGLSATVGNPKQVAAWLSPPSPTTRVKTLEPIIVSNLRGTELLVQSEPPVQGDEAFALELGMSNRAYANLRRVASILKNESPCLVFVNSRNTAETVAQRVQTLAPELNIGVHHGSLAAETRQEMEDDIRSGKLHGLVCTSSLELGIDVGSIRRIIQLKSPRSVDRMLQRVGRADHRLGGVGIGDILAWDADDVAESAAIARRALQGQIEGIEWRERPLAVAANQLILLAHSHKLVMIDEATKIIGKAPQFSNWKREETVELLNILADGWLLRVVDNPRESPWWEWSKLAWEKTVEYGKTKGIDLPQERPEIDKESRLPAKKYRDLKPPIPPELERGWYSPAGRTRQWVMSHLSMIPNRQKYRVRDAVTRKSLGSVDEAFVLSLNDSGEDEDGGARRFVMAGRTWTIIDADPEKEELLVAPVGDQGTAPVWSGELPPTPPEVAREIGRIRALVAEELGWIPPESAKVLDPAGLCSDEDLELSDLPLDKEALGLLFEEIQAHLEVAGDVPTNRLLTIENRDNAISLNICQGSRINEAIAHLLQAMASTKTGKLGRIIVEPTRIALQSGGIKPNDIIGWLMDTPPDALEALLGITMPNSRQVRWRFAQVAKIFGILRSGIDPRRINMQSLVRKYRGTAVMKEVLGKLFFERMDVEGAADVLRAIQTGLFTVKVTPPGPLGLSNRGGKDLLLPNWSNEQVRQRLEGRLMNERAVLICLVCKGAKKFRVARFPSIEARCSCGGRLLACAPERLRSDLEKRIDSPEEADQNRVQRNAEAIKRRGMDAILCLMARGVGGATANRILRQVQSGNRDNLLEAIHHAEINYARTRRFW